MASTESSNGKHILLLRIYNVYRLARNKRHCNTRRVASAYPVLLPVATVHHPVTGADSPEMPIMLSSGSTGQPRVTRPRLWPAQSTFQAVKIPLQFALLLPCLTEPDAPPGGNDDVPFPGLTAQNKPPSSGCVAYTIEPQAIRHFCQLNAWPLCSPNTPGLHPTISICWRPGGQAPLSAFPDNVEMNIGIAPVPPVTWHWQSARAWQRYRG